MRKCAIHDANMRKYAQKYVKTRKDAQNTAKIRAIRKKVQTTKENHKRHTQIKYAKVRKLRKKMRNNA